MQCHSTQYNIINMFKNYTSGLKAIKKYESAYYTALQKIILNIK